MKNHITSHITDHWSVLLCVWPACVFVSTSQPAESFGQFSTAGFHHVIPSGNQTWLCELSACRFYDILTHFLSVAERKTSRSDWQRSCEKDVVRYMCVRVCVLLMSVSQTVGEASWGDEWAVPPSTMLGCQSNTAIYKPRSWQADGESGRGSQRAIATLTHFS